MLSITSLKKGTVFALDGVPYRVLEYSQKVMGRGGSTVNVKIKSLTDGKVLAKTFHGNDQVDNANINYADCQYLYKDAHQAHFMTNSNFDSIEIGLDSVKDQLVFLKEGENVMIQLFDGRPIGIELPKNLPLKVTYTENAVKGDTSSAITKDAKLETGITIKVPAFIKQGDIVSVDTATGEYRERQK
ncbi:MAG TPA: elongation factor P [Candidatus Nitrosopolaris sp.]|nr:elongation factor P [Candidatus Nitrosopolaris sp.]